MSELKTLQIKINGLTKAFQNEQGITTDFIESLSCLLELKSGIVNTLLSQYPGESRLLLKIIAGIDKSFNGKVEYESGGKNKAGIKTVYIPQKPSSFPWLNVQENIELGFQKNVLPNEEVLKRKKTILNEAGLEGYEQHYPNNNSFGFRFRISLARALAHNPDLIILDTPFSEMDIQTKKELYLLLNNLTRSESIVILLFTSDPFEAGSISDEVILWGNKQEEPLEQINLSGLQVIEKIKKLTDRIAEQR